MSLPTLLLTILFCLVRWITSIFYANAAEDIRMDANSKITFFILFPYVIIAFEKNPHLPNFILKFWRAFGVDSVDAYLVGMEREHTRRLWRPKLIPIIRC